jgi:hypothetical protein
MRDNGFTKLRNGQSIWKCLKWGLKRALRGKIEKSLSKGWGLESAFEGKWEMVCKQKDDICEKLKDFFFEVV